LIKSDSKWFLLKEQEINFVEAAGNYVQVSLESATLLARISLTKLASLLNTDRFVRIHRSAIVNLDQIAHLEPDPGGEYIMTLRCGKKLKASRTYVAELLRSVRGHTGEECLSA
jgi:two-component system LytT family response regulator